MDEENIFAEIAEIEKLFPMVAESLTSRNSLLQTYSARINIENGDLPRELYERCGSVIGKNDVESNCDLKQIVRKYLGEKRISGTGDITDEVLKIYGWIVHKWGGIKRFSVKDKERIFSFIRLKIKEYYPIASLSKIASFSSEDCFVYDSRVAISLNYLLLEAGGSAFFKMLPPRGGNSEVVKRIKYRIMQKGGDYLTQSDSYLTYCNFINKCYTKVFGEDACPDKLEMLLFTMAKCGVDEPGYVYNIVKSWPTE